MHTQHVVLSPGNIQQVNHVFMKYTHKHCFNAHQFAACNAFERTVFNISIGKWSNITDTV